MRGGAGAGPAWDTATVDSARYSGVAFLGNVRELPDKPDGFVWDAAARTVTCLPREGQDMRRARAVTPHTEGVLGGLDLETVLAAELLDRLDPRQDRVVNEVRDLGEDQNTERRCLGAGSRGHPESERQRQQGSDGGEGQKESPRGMTPGRSRCGWGGQRG